MPSGENSTADSLTKMHDVLSERMLLESSRMSSANWQRAQRLAYGEACNESDMGAEEMILVDSTVTITHNTTAPTEASAAARSHDRTAPALPTKTPAGSSAGPLLKIAAGVALVASGAGAGVGIPLLLSGGSEVVQNVSERASETQAERPKQSQSWTLELGK